jgi:hypothetical protein
MKNSNALFFAGTFAIIIGWLTSFILYVLIIGVIIYVVGVILVCLSDKKIKVQLITIFLPMLLWYPVFKLLF